MPDGAHHGFGVGNTSTPKGRNDTASAMHCAIAPGSACKTGAITPQHSTPAAAMPKTACDVRVWCMGRWLLYRMVMTPAASILSWRTR